MNGSSRPESAAVLKNFSVISSRRAISSLHFSVLCAPLRKNATSDPTPASLSICPCSFSIAIAVLPVLRSIAAKAALVRSSAVTMTLDSTAMALFRFLVMYLVQRRFNQHHGLAECRWLLQRATAPGQETGFVVHVQPQPFARGGADHGQKTNARFDHARDR